MLPLLPNDIDVRFSIQPKWRDLGWSFLFILHLFGVWAILIVSALRYWVWDAAAPTTQSLIITAESTVKIGILVGISGAIAIGISIIWLVLLFYFTRPLIISSMILSVVMWVALGIYVFFTGSLIYGILLIFLALLTAFFFYSWRNRIEFAVVLLQHSIDLARRYPATVVSGFLAALLHAIWVLLWSFTVVLALRYERLASSLLFIYLLLSFYWVSQVIKNTNHVTAAGTFASSYFMGSSMPPNPTLQSFKRATTYSFGSICLGSLLIAIIQTIRALIRSTRDSCGMLAAFADCIMSCIDWMVQYFNHYAFVEISIYGKSFWKAAKDTYELFKRSGILILINDNIVGVVLGLGGLYVGVITAIIGGCFALSWFNSDIVFVVIVCFFIGMTTVSIIQEVISSGISTLFVCFAEDPQALLRQNEPLYMKFMDAMRR